MFKKRLVSYASIAFGATIAAVSINTFLLPNKLVAGGASGIATMLNLTLGVPLGAVVILVNIPLFFMAFFYMGESIGYKAMFGTAMLSLMLDITKDIPSVTHDLFLATLAGGFVMGLGLGIVFVNGATTGGSDIAARLLNKRFPYISIAKFLLIIDIFVVLISGFIFDSFDIVIYATIGLFVASYVIDSIESGVDYAKAAFIISDRPEEIAKGIMANVNRGITGFYGKGMFKDSDKIILMCVIKRHEIGKLKKTVRRTDENAFVILTDIKEVLGEGFKNNFV